MSYQEKKGHFPDRIHIELITKVQRLVPDGASVVVLGDRELDGVDLQALVKGSDWECVLRTSKTTALTWDGEEFRFDDVTDHVAPGGVYDVPSVLITQRKYGPVLAATWWRKDCREPIHLATNMTSAEEACNYYRKRFKIETLFSDQKSRGFHLHKGAIHFAQVDWSCSPWTSGGTCSRPFSLSQPISWGLNPWFSVQDGTILGYSPVISAEYPCVSGI